MPDVAWWATVVGTIASVSVLLGAIVTFWTEYGRSWFRRQFDIDDRLDDIVETNQELCQSVDRNNEAIADLSADHREIKVLAMDAFEQHNELVGLIAEEFEIPEDNRPTLDADRARERLFGGQPYSGDFTRGADD